MRSSRATLVLEVGALGAVVDDGALDGLRAPCPLRAAAATWRRTPRGPTRRCGRAGRGARSARACSPRDRTRPLLGALTRARRRRASGASKALPSRRARNASVTSLPVRTTGGAAGTSMRRALSRPMASTMPVSAERVTARASTLGSRAATLPGMASTTSARRSGSTSAGVQRTAYDAWSPRDEPLPASALAQHRHHRASCRELDRPHRDLAQPADARADVVAHVAGTGGHEPAEHLADRRARPRRPSRRRARPRPGARSTARRALRRRRGTWPPRRRWRWDSPGHRPRRRPGRAPTRAADARRRAR